jgi:hypothetical protein
MKAGAKLSDVLYLDTNLLLAEAYSEELVPHCEVVGKIWTAT